MQRRQFGDRGELRLDLVVDHDRIPKTQPAVNDAVRDSGDARGRIFERSDWARRIVSVDDRELDARRAGVDDEDFAQ